MPRSSLKTLEEKRAEWRAAYYRRFAKDPERMRETNRNSQRRRIKDIIEKNEIWRNANREQTRATGAIGQARIKLRNRDIIIAAKDKPCTDCGVKYASYVMDLDHVRGKKHRQVSQMKYCSVQNLLDEIAKCEVVCANCHRERTYRRLHP